MNASKLEIITSMAKVSDLKRALSKIGVTGMTVLQAIGCGSQKGTFEYSMKENVEMELLPKMLIILMVDNDMLDKVVEIIKETLYTGHIGDGKIFITPVTNIIRVRTGEDGMSAL